MFKDGEIVLYKNQERYELGIVKCRYDGAADGRECYRVYYHTGDTTALTDATDMIKLVNESLIPEMIVRFKTQMI